MCWRWRVIQNERGIHGKRTATILPVIARIRYKILDNHVINHSRRILLLIFMTGKISKIITITTIMSFEEKQTKYTAAQL